MRRREISSGWGLEAIGCAMSPGARSPKSVRRCALGFSSLALAGRHLQVQKADFGDEENFQPPSMDLVLACFSISMTVEQGPKSLSTYIILLGRVFPQHRELRRRSASGNLVSG